MDPDVCGGRRCNALSAEAVTGPGTVCLCMVVSQGSGAGTQVPGRTALIGTRSSGLKKAPRKPPGPSYATPASGMNWRPLSTK